MQLTDLFTNDEERAVSPVIGVILMVAITVILAAVIGTFVLGLGDQVQETSPNAQWDTEYDDPASGGDSVTITHTSGDSVNGDLLTVAVSNATDGGTAISWDQSSDTTFDGTDVTAGDSATIDDSSAGWSSSPTDLQMQGSTVRLIWESEGGGSSSTLTTWEGAAA
jgi:flagellin-like protein